MKANENNLMDIDALMDEQFGKVGSKEREEFRTEAYNYCVGQLILDARKSEHMTQQALADRLGTSKSYISRVEKGVVEPGVGMFLRIIEALGLRFELTKPLPALTAGQM